jgi:hypothetical protein
MSVEADDPARSIRLAAARTTGVSCLLNGRRPGAA